MCKMEVIILVRQKFGL
uniref:Uncharacterized protein n=1 Tax=Arundo donax TaxID=35708 RepID=A0A0A9CDD2_ARUDO